jgi:putative DNA primase/helicase
VTNHVFNRPGVTDPFLVEAGCHHVGSDECCRLYGFRAEGIAIPFRDSNGSSITDNGKPYSRVRLYQATDEQKYHQRSGSGVHIYIPHTLATACKGSRLVLVEGEFKSMALAESGFAAVGLCGINGALGNVDGEVELHRELVETLEFHQPACIVFVGDSDTVFNSDFAREVSKLRKVLFATKRFKFVEEIRVAVCPLDGPKGVDDVRIALGGQFKEWFESLTEAAFIVPAKSAPEEIFCALLRREMARVQVAVKGDSHDAHHNRIKLLQSAHRLMQATGALLLIKPTLAEILNVKETSIPSMIRDARPTVHEASQPKQMKGSVTLRDVEPWEHPVNGAELLDEIVAFYEKFVVLPLTAADVLAVWCLQTWCYELFDFAAIVAVWSPEHECGKGRVLDITEKIVRRPFRTSNTSAAVLYHVISKGNLTVLVDELDSVNEEQRSAICNILNSGFQSNGTAHRMTEMNGAQAEIEFPTFCPKMIATITLDKLGKATRSRTIAIRMQRKARSQKVGRFRRIDAIPLQRKCMRWAQDNAEAIKALPPIDINECATDRQEDVWEPLVAIGRVVGGDWEKRIRIAATQLASGSSDGASETVGHQLLAALQSFFKDHGNCAETKTIIAALNDDFADLNHGRGLTPQFIAKLLRPYGIEPRVHKIAGKPARGYSREDCEQAFATYLSERHPRNPAEKCNSVTNPEFTDPNPVFENVTVGNGYTSQSAVSAPENEAGYEVTVPTVEKTENEAKWRDADLL